MYALRIKKALFLQESLIFFLRLIICVFSGIAMFFIIAGGNPEMVFKRFAKRVNRGVV